MCTSTTRPTCDMAIRIADNAKTQRYGTCNAMETLLVARRHRRAGAAARSAHIYLEQGRGAARRRTRRAQLRARRCKPPARRTGTPNTSRRSSRSRVVDRLDEAIAHIATYGSQHTDAIVTEDYTRRDALPARGRFGSVMVNASTRFADGFEYGLGAEIGISTDKLHARGPVGLEGSDLAEIRRARRRADPGREPQEATRLAWYFDFVSPYSYLQFAAYPELMQTAALRPVLFAGLLNHWGGKGPAEIPAKRLQTYRYTYWQAGQHGIEMIYPPAHPFNPIHALRLALALGSRYDAVKTMFEFIWKEGRSVTDEWPALAERLELTAAAADALIAEPRVKEALAANGRAAHSARRVRRAHLRHPARAA